MSPWLFGIAAAISAAGAGDGARRRPEVHEHVEGARGIHDDLRRARKSQP